MNTIRNTITVRGTVGPKVLAKSGELFRQDLATILRELLQNARRANASRVDIETFEDQNQTIFVLRDDGDGVADPQSLVTFGQSNWDGTLDAIENAAGMGTYSLAARGATVRSNGWRVTLTPAVFVGKDEASVLPDRYGPSRGCEVTFSLTGSERDWEHLVKSAAKFFPVPVFLNDNPLEKRDFLAEAIAVEEWQGIRIGVFNDRLGSREHVEPKPHINFHGAIAQALDDISVSEIHGPTWKVALDVIEAPDLKLVLPTRHHVVANDFYRLLMAKCRKAMFEAIARQPEHTLPFKVTSEARTMGVELADATIRLLPWHPHSDRLSFGRSSSTINAQSAACALVPFWTAQPPAGSNLGLVRHDPRMPRLAKEICDYEGYAHYDALPRVQQITVRAELRDGSQMLIPLLSDEENGEMLSGLLAAAGMSNADDYTVVVNDLNLEIEIAGGGKTQVVSIPSDIAFVDDDVDGMGVESAPAFVRHGTSPILFADALMEYWFQANDDFDSDSYDTQKDNAYNEARARARRVLLPANEAVIHNVIDDMNIKPWQLDHAKLVRLEIRKLPPTGPDDRIARYAITGETENGASVTVEL